MLTPLDLSYGAVATETLRSIATQLEERAQEERERTGNAPKPDELTKARIAVSKEAQESRGKIISAMLSNQHVSTIEMVMALADKVAEKLGIDTSKDRSYLMLGKIIGDLIDKMDVGARRGIEEAVGLDKLGISIATFASALSDPTGAARSRLDEALLKTAGRNGVTEATSRIVARLEDAADPQSIEEIKAREQIDDPSRPKDAAGQQERLEALESAKAFANLEDVQVIREKLAEQTKEAVAGDAAIEDGDLLLLLAAIPHESSEGASPATGLAKGDGQEEDRTQAGPGQPLIDLETIFRRLYDV